jgi:hypothetical protein
MERRLRGLQILGSRVNRFSLETFPQKRVRFSGQFGLPVMTGAERSESSNATQYTFDVENHQTMGDLLALAVLLVFKYTVRHGGVFSSRTSTL